ncbi:MULTISPECIES: hypothetical protein [unclassified Geodermatophilus]
MALGRGQSVTTTQRAGLTHTSSSESDRYEELLVHPAVVLLLRQRGEIDCGGLDHVVVRYGRFSQIVVSIEDGHLSVAVELHADPLQVARLVLDRLTQP